MVNIKIIVQPTPQCIKILKYLKLNIDKINDVGFRVQVEELTPKQKEMLSKSNISLLPVIITPDKKMFVGTDKIIELFERNINKTNGTAPAKRRSSRGGEGGGLDVSDYLCNEIYAGVERGKKGMIVPQEREKGSDEDIDFNKKLSAYKRPKHYMPPGDDSSEGESEEDRAKPARKPQRPPPKARTRQPVQQEYSSDEDNIPDNEKATAGDDPLTSYMNTPGVDVNDQMMRCLLENL
jgi:hypothetical protein